MTLQENDNIFFVITGDEEARAAAGEGSKQGTAETPAANRGEIGPAQPSNTHYLSLKCHKNIIKYGLNVILSTFPHILNLENI